MRRFLAVFVVIIVIAVTGVAFAEVQLDFSKSYSEVLDTQTLRIRHISNVVIDGVPIAGEFWADIVWNQNALIFAPNGNVEQEQLPMEFDGTYTGSWSVTCPACGYTAAGTFTTTLANGVFTHTGLSITSGIHSPLFTSGTVSSSGAITGTGVGQGQCDGSVSTFTGQITNTSSGGAVMNMTYSRNASAGGCEAEYGTITATRTILP